MLSAPIVLSSKSKAATVMAVAISGDIVAGAGIITDGVEVAATTMVGGIIAIGGNNPATPKGPPQLAVSLT